MEHYFNGHVGGMHYIWWVIWIIVLIWIFFTHYDIPGQRKKKDTPMDILKKSYAGGEINKEEFEEKKVILEKKVDQIIHLN